MFRVKSLLGGQKFASDTEVKSADRQWLRQQPASCFLQKAFRNLLIDGDFSIRAQLNYAQNPYFGFVIH